MNFKPFIRLLAWTAACLLSAGGEMLPEEFVRRELGTVPDPQTLRMTGDVGREAAAIMRRRYPRSWVTFWQADGRTVWVLEGLGKTDLIEAGFVIEQGRIVTSEVLRFQETRGGQIASKRFLKQFFGVSLTDKGELSRKIDGYSGATYSVDAMRKMARLALFLDGQIAFDAVRPADP